MRSTQWIRDIALQFTQLLFAPTGHIGMQFFVPDTHFILPSVLSTFIITIVTSTITIYLLRTTKEINLEKSKIYRKSKCPDTDEITSGIKKLKTNNHM